MTRKQRRKHKKKLKHESNPTSSNKSIEDMTINVTAFLKIKDEKNIE